MLGDKDMFEANNRLVVEEYYMLLLLLKDQLIGIDWHPSTKLSFGKHNVPV